MLQCLDVTVFENQVIVEKWRTGELIVHYVDGELTMIELAAKKTVLHTLFDIYIEMVEQPAIKTLVVEYEDGIFTATRNDIDNRVDVEFTTSSDDD